MLQDGWVGWGWGGGFIIVNDIETHTKHTVYTYVRMYNKIYNEKVRTCMYRVVQLQEK